MSVFQHFTPQSASVGYFFLVPEFISFLFLRTSPLLFASAAPSLCFSFTTPPPTSNPLFSKSYPCSTASGPPPIQNTLFHKETTALTRNSRPFFKKSERFHEPESKAQFDARVASHKDVVGLEGPVDVCYPSEYTASHGLWHDTLNAVGVESNDAHLAGSNLGCWTSVVSVNPADSSRSYATTAYYLPNKSRPNLVVLTQAQVQEVILAEEDGSWQAKGARFTDRDGVEHSAFASREVIISAGSVQSPQILELSGIGRRDVLTAAGISVKIENANVGENLQDHMSKFRFPSHLATQITN